MRPLPSTDEHPDEEPIGKLPPEPYTLPLKGTFEPILTRMVDTNTRRFAASIGSPVVRAAQISDRFAATNRKRRLLLFP